MGYLYLFLLLISCCSYIHTQSFTEESPYMIIRFIDLSLNAWKPARLDELEQILDDELKYSDAKKGIECKSIDFEQEAGYPKVTDRFLDLSVRGLCTDEDGKVHSIQKELIIVAIERRIKEVNTLLDATVYSAGNVQIFKYNRNILNIIIIPIAVGFILILLILTFVLRRVRYSQKRRHILSKLEEKKKNSSKKSQTTANVDPNANEKQRLLQLDPTVVGSASHTLGSPKEFTHEQHSSPTHGYNREYPGAPPPPIPSKENRPPYFSRDDETSFQNQRSNRSSRERVHIPYENEPRFFPNQYEPQHQDMIPMQEQQPRVVVRTIHDDGNYPSNNQPYGGVTSSTQFVPIPVHVERSGPHQRFVQPPYHSDPHYRNVNS